MNEMLTILNARKAEAISIAEKVIKIHPDTDGTDGIMYALFCQDVIYDIYGDGPGGIAYTPTAGTMDHDEVQHLLESEEVAHVELEIWIIASRNVGRIRLADQLINIQKNGL